MVAYNSLFSGLYTNGEFIYVLYTAFQRTATLSINNFNGTAPSIIPDLGRDGIIRMWLLKIDINDVTNILKITPFGDPSTNTFPAFNSNDYQTLLYKDMYELDNGNIVMEG